MNTPAWKLALLASVFCAAGAVAEEDKEEPNPGEPRYLSIPRTKAPVIDGKLDDAIWAQGASVELLRGKDVHATITMTQTGRVMHIGARVKGDPATLALRINIVDPVTKVDHALAIIPSNAPRAPLEAWREFFRRGPEQLSVSTARLRFSFHDKGWNAELALPLDLVEFARGQTTYRVSFELWYLPKNKPVAVYPGEGGLTPGVGFELIRPAVDWGAGEPRDANPQKDPALALLERIAAETSKRKIGDLPREALLHAHLGWRDGRRKDAPLQALEKELVALMAAYPDYVGLNANLAIVKIGRGDFNGALKSLDAMADVIPSLAHQPRRAMIRVELLRNVGRFEEAIKTIESHPELTELAEAKAGLIALRRMKQDWALAQKMLAADATADDLPRIKVETTKGPFVIELFEDDAPNAVASMISLAAAKYYDGTRVHWCSGGRRVMAGDPNSRDDDPSNDGYGDPGYILEPEHSRRQHWIYRVSLVDKRDQRFSEGGTFMIHLANAPIFDGAATCVGIVVEGRDVLGRLEYGDEIKSVRVLRKRDHAYAVTKRKP